MMAAPVAMAWRQEGLQMHALEHGCVSWERVPAGRGAGRRGWWWTQAEDAEGCSEGDERDSESGEDWNGRAG